MKRSRLTRRVPLKPSSKGLKRSRLARQSPKKRKERRDTDGPREAYRELFKRCQCCRKRRSKETHEMASGGVRCQAVYHRETYLSVCGDCHRKIHRTNEWPLSRQLWAKQQGDSDYYDRRLVLRLKGWDEETAITQEEVDAWSKIA